jgi:hypothetical protein
MSRPSSWLLAVAIASVSIAAAPSATSHFGGMAAAFHCQVCWEYESGPSHQFLSTECSSDQPQCFDCHEFNSCHSDIQSGRCFSFHNYCAASFAAMRMH